MKQDNITELAGLRDEKEILDNSIRSFVTLTESGKEPTQEQLEQYDSNEADLMRVNARIDVLEKAERAKSLTSKRSDVFGSPVIKVRRKANQDDSNNAWKAWALNYPATRRQIKDDWKRSADLLNIDWESDQWQVRAQSSDVTGEGKEFINENVYRGFVEAKAAYGGMLEVANVINVPTAESLKYVTDNDTGNVAAKHTNQNDAVSNVDVANLDSVSISPAIYSSGIFPVSLQLVRDAHNDIAAWIGRKLTRRLLKKINVDLTNALMSATTLGATAGTTLDYQDLGNLFFSIDPEYVTSPKTCLMGNYAMLHTLWETFVDPNEGPTWGDGLNGSPSRSILGQRYVVNQAMANYANGNEPLVFGDFDNFIVHTVGSPVLQRANELYMNTLSIGFQMYWEVDGDLVDAGTHPIKHMTVINGS